MSSASILYYPSIEFASYEWVKSSLLLWDYVYRIVPENYETHDSPAVRRLCLRITYASSLRLQISMPIMPAKSTLFCLRCLAYG
ncbi:hypothetical protein J2W55_004565 [Mucilaginibacter pocheonensis]|uniref:Uncharacterized protein n=1 Tax=Mucilaginibacter pocheonensis TaxID=398050 RepID=A0ABU1THL1_9SPHI|nr:hypothetical protein [Mucilaginibacter pocheonensis]